MIDIAVVSASHNDRILAANLARSPMIASGAVPLHVERGAGSAAVALNRGLDATRAEIVVFAHHDCYLPPGWERVLQRRLAEVAAFDPDWALYGPFGVARDGAHIGPVWSSSLGMIVGRVPLAPTEVQSYDELMIILRRSSGLRFDQALPGWHLYGTDIVASANAAGRRAYAGALPTLHNDAYHEALQSDFAECYHALRRKWRGQLPRRSPIIKISASGLHLWKNRWADFTSREFRANMAIGTAEDPARLAGLCGWADLSASA